MGAACERGWPVVAGAARCRRSIVPCRIWRDMLPGADIAGDAHIGWFWARMCPCPDRPDSCNVIW
jgi:hypothetical protein